MHIISDHQDSSSHLPVIYLAGKINKYDWRDALIKNCRSALGYTESGARSITEVWHITEPADGVLGAFPYVGPYFIGCDHGCYHGSSNHGLGVSDYLGCNGEGTPFDAPVRRQIVWRHILSALQSADLVFAWLEPDNKPDDRYGEGQRFSAYGTIAELAYAAALGKRVWIACPEPLDDLWLVQQMAEQVCVGVKSPKHAFITMVIAHGPVTWRRALSEAGKLDW